MNRYALAFALLVAAGGQSAYADVMEDIVSSGKVICGVLGNNQPFAYQDPDTRELVGYEVDLCRLVGESLGVGYEVRSVSGEARIPELVQGRVHLLAARLSNTPARAEQVDFSNVYMVDSLRCFSTNPELTTNDDLADVRIGITQGSILQSVLEARFENPQIVVYRDAPLLFLSVEQGRVEAGCNATGSIMNYMRRNESQFHLIEEPIFLQRIGFVVRKGEPEFVQHLNTLLAELEANGTGVELFEKWIAPVLGVEREFTFLEDSAQ